MSYYFDAYERLAKHYTQLRETHDRIIEGYNELVSEVNRVNRVLDERDARIAELERQLAETTESTQE
jgi:hypothetical protein